MTKPIVAERLARRFDEVVAVDGVDLELEPGEIFGFLGPNARGSPRRSGCSPHFSNPPRDARSSPVTMS
jgi:ABC-type branched-subunit amino acid transport system ATPase component